MNAHEHLTTKKYARAVIKLGIASMLVSVVLFLISYYSNNTTLIFIFPSLVAGTLMFVPGLIVIFIGLGMRKKGMILPDSFNLAQAQNYQVDLMHVSEEKSKNATVIVELGIASMLISVGLFLIVYYLHDIPFSLIFPSLVTETLMFVFSLIVVFIGLLIGRLIKQANLAEKSKNATVIVEWGVVLMSSSIVSFSITCFYNYALVLQQIKIRDISMAWGWPNLITILIFVLGFIMLLIGLLIGLVGRLKKQESL
jgi:hypothetical protein